MPSTRAERCLDARRGAKARESRAVRFDGASSFDQCLKWETAASGSNDASTYRSTPCQGYLCGVNRVENGNACPGELVVVTDAIIQGAVADWLTFCQPDRSSVACAEKVTDIYGPIEDWKTAAVTDYEALFCGRGSECVVRGVNRAKQGAQTFNVEVCAGIKVSTWTSARFDDVSNYRGVQEGADDAHTGGHLQIGHERGDDLPLHVLRRLCLQSARVRAVLVPRRASMRGRSACRP